MKFVTPEIEVVKFNVVDVITASTETTTEGVSCNNETDIF